MATEEGAGQVTGHPSRMAQGSQGAEGMYLFEMAVEGRLVVVERPYEYPAVRVLWHRLTLPGADLDIPHAAGAPEGGGDARVVLQTSRAVG